MTVPQNVRYTKSHEWARKDGALFTVGITEYAQKEVSDVVYVELPAVGKEVKAGDAVCVVESVKAAFDIYAPLAGTITEVNTALEGDPSLVNSDSFGAGWMFKIKAAAEKDYDHLMDASTYTTHVAAAGH